jgi:hypothetical protein
LTFTPRRNLLILSLDFTPEIDTLGVGCGPTVTEFDAAEAPLVPTRFVAVTVNVTDEPVVSPVTVADVRASVVVTVCPLKAITV